MGSPTELDYGGLTLVTKDIKVNASAPGQAGTSISAAELTFLDGVTAGTATASKAVVLDSLKGIATITSATITTLTAPTVNATNVDAGASGTAGTVDVFPTTASKGKLAITCADQTGNTTVTLTTAAMGQATAITLPDPGGATASVVLTEGTQTINGAKTFGSDITLGAATTLNLDSATATLSSHAATVTKYAVQVTTEALTTAAAASQAFVITLTGAAATDLAFCQLCGGTNTQGTPILNAVMTSNTATVTVKNHHASEALNGTLKFNLWIVKA